jgi:hypothetical protein
MFSIPCDMFVTSIDETFTDANEEEVLFKLQLPSVHYPEFYLPADTFRTDSFRNKYEEIWSYRGSRRGRSWKPVQHYKRWTSPKADNGGFTHLIDNATDFHGYRIGVHKDPYWGYRGGYGPGNEPFTGLVPMYVKVGEGQFIPAPSQYAQLQQRSLDRLLPLIKSELSIINSIIELKDFQSLPRTLASLGKFLIKSGRTLRSAFHTAADSYLQAQFNILPLLSDISGIHAALLKTSARINDLVSRAGRVQEKHWSFSWDEFPADNYLPNGNGYFIQPNIVPGLHDIAPTIARRLTVNYPTTFHAQIRYNYNYLEYQAAHAQILGFLDAIGANLNPSIIWNAIPWTFVVDWVVGVSRWLDQFKHYALEPQINILSYLSSVKRQRSVYLTTENGPIDTVIFGEYFYPQRYPVLRNPLPGVHETSYRRDVSIPTISSILTSGLTLKEVSLGAALVVTRKFNPKKAKRWHVRL